jgi:hypothetical protein
VVPKLKSSSVLVPTMLASAVVVVVLNSKPTGVGSGVGSPGVGSGVGARMQAY